MELQGQSCDFHARSGAELEAYPCRGVEEHWGVPRRLGVVRCEGRARFHARLAIMGTRMRRAMDSDARVLVSGQPGFFDYATLR